MLSENFPEYAKPPLLVRRATGGRGKGALTVTHWVVGGTKADETVFYECLGDECSDAIALGLCDACKTDILEYIPMPRNED